MHSSGALHRSLRLMARSIIEHLQHRKYPRLKIQLRARSRFYQAVTFLDGRKAQRSLKTSDPETAMKLGESWYRSRFAHPSPKPNNTTARPYCWTSVKPTFLSGADCPVTATAERTSAMRGVTVAICLMNTT